MVDLPDKQPTNSTQNYFLYAGALEKYKGVDTLIGAMKGMPDTTLKIAGTGSEQDQLKMRAKDLAKTAL